MNYRISLVSRTEREAQIKNSVQSSAKTLDFYEFRNTKTSLKVIRIDLSIPVYRMENFRTFTYQREFLRESKKENDFFIKGQEVESAQQEQHDILAKLAQKSVSDSVSVFDVLKKEKQREPILIASNGVVVNGNRRLAAMRELYAENQTTFAEFSHVDCMVLPEDATADEIVDVEAALQAKPETKLDYDWIGDAKLIDRLVSMGRTPRQIAEKLNRSEREVKNSLQALKEAELYLKDWAHAEGDYSKIKEGGEQLFKDLPKLLDGKDRALQDASRIIAWSLFDKKDLPGRIYDYNPAIGKLADDVIERTCEILDLSSDVSEEDDEEFSIDLENSDQSLYDTFIDTLKDESLRDNAVEALVEACQSAIETEKGQKSGEAALKAIVQAHTKLVSVDLSKASPATFDPIAKQLSSIKVLLERLTDRIEELKK